MDRQTLRRMALIHITQIYNKLKYLLYIVLRSTRRRFYLPANWI